jgi:hypothetical protein
MGRERKKRKKRNHGNEGRKESGKGGRLRKDYVKKGTEERRKGEREEA